ncbi:hypothetical protein CSC76_17105 [Pseudoxanthomonas mexicana]|uniref:hypothetical protein n=1 Tax=Pseudoxanthomonas mexicana TaxID=128785 RepID=UPI00138A2A79|nr:hypothetical protein [Pseudoxanthomonas mexicana]KAF1720453.1 hypothetical protein CSC76_17105 [Pseudoxanthomonas mexicana]
MYLHLSRVAIALLSLLPLLALAKPIAFARGTTVMVEYGAETMNEVQVFYAPRYWYSAGAGWLELTSEDGQKQRHITYLRGNLLAKRWNMPEAQANVFVWGGLGRGTGNDFQGDTFVRNAGFQVDYETRRVYSAFRSDLQDSDQFSHRIDTLQLGWAPYKHDYDTLATWVVVQGRRYTGQIMEGTETAVLIRFFKRGTWVEVGATTDGNLQAMAMFNF